MACVHYTFPCVERFAPMWCLQLATFGNAATIFEALFFFILDFNSKSWVSLDFTFHKRREICFWSNIFPLSAQSRWYFLAEKRVEKNWWKSKKYAEDFIKHIQEFHLSFARCFNFLSVRYFGMVFVIHLHIEKGFFSHLFLHSIFLPLFFNKIKHLKHDDDFSMQACSLAFCRKTQDFIFIVSIFLVLFFSSHKNFRAFFHIFISEFIWIMNAIEWQQSRERIKR